MSLSTAYLNTTSATSSLSSLIGTPTSSAVSSPTDSDAAPTSSTSSSAATASLSDRARLFQQLKQLEQSNPAEFKKVTADIAKQLQSAAKTVGGSEGTALSNLADEFQQASQSGSLSAFRSGHRHHGGSGANSQQASGASAYQGGTQSGTASQVDSVISQVLTQDLGSSSAATATTDPAATA